MNIADKLTLIAENEQKVYDAGKIALLKDSKYMRGTASGELVSLNDVSPVEHTVGVEVSSKNLFDCANAEQQGGLRASVVDRSENHITAKVGAGWNRWQSVVFALPETLVGKMITLSISGAVCSASNNMAIRVQWMKDYNGTAASGTNMAAYINGNKVSASGVVPEKPSDALFLGLVFHPNADSADAVEGDTVTFSNAQVEVGSTATAYTPYADTSAAKIQVLGKNWLSSKFVIGGLSGGNGNETNLTTRARVDDYIEAKPNTRYTISGTGDYLVANRMAYDKNKKWLGGWHSGTTPAETAFVRFHLTHKDDTQEITEEDLALINTLPIQLELGAVATEYEPYKGTKYSQGESVKSIHPTMNIMTDTEGASVDVEYLRDIDAYIDNLVGAAAVMTLEEV